MERSAADGSAATPFEGRRREPESPELSVVLTDPPPSLSGAHWANRDNDMLHRRQGRTAPFRRPPAENSFPEGNPAGPPPPTVPFAQREPQATAWPAAADAIVEPPARHWTTLGDGARRPKTSDRGEVNAPAVAPKPHRQRPAAQERGDQPDSWFGETPAGTTALSAGSAAGNRAGPTGAASGGGPAGRGAGGEPTRGGRREPRAVDADPDSSGAELPVGWPAPGPKSSRPVRSRSARDVDPEADRLDTGSLLGGPGHEIRAHRAGRRDGPPPTAPEVSPARAGGPDAPAGRRSRAVRWASLALGLVVLLGGAAAGVVFFSDTTGGLASVLRNGTGPAKDRSVSAPRGGRNAASFEVITGTGRATVRSEDIGGDLYRITSAEDAGSVPRPVVDGDKVQLHLVPAGDGTSGNVDVVLSAAVRWSLRFTGGADEQVIDLSGGKVSAVEFVGGARRIELSLPAAVGTVGVRLRGAVDELVVRAPEQNPVRVRVDSGAKTVAAGERTLRDVPPGSTVTPKAWDTKNRYDVDAAARVTLLSVESAG